MRWFLRSKISKAIVTEVKLSYEGSIGIDKALMKKAGFLDGEKVLVVDNTRGVRLETYIVAEKENSGKVVIYGGACHLIKKDDEITIMGFEMSNKAPKPKKILVDKNNKFVKYL